MTIAGLAASALLQNLAFLAAATVFFLFAGRAYLQSARFEVPRPYPRWFGAWLKLVLVGGIAMPALCFVYYGFVRAQPGVVIVLGAYFVTLAIQIAYEITATRRWGSPLWVAVPCVFLTWRLWQCLWGADVLERMNAPRGAVATLWLLLALWIFNYAVHLGSLPRLLRWPRRREDPA